MKAKIKVRTIEAKTDLASTIELDILKAGSRVVTEEEMAMIRKSTAEAEKVEIELTPEALDMLIEEGLKPEDVISAIIKGEVKDVRRLD